MSLRKRRDPKERAEQQLVRAEAALDEALQEKAAAQKQSTWRERLQEGWDRVHERNNLSELFLDEYRRTR